MLKKTMQVGPATKARVTTAPGDLRVTGWDLDEISAKTDGDVLDILLDGDVVTISCDSDLILNIPRRLALDIEAVSGDADVRELPGGVTLRQVEGDLSLRTVGAASIGTVMGDVEARESGPLTIDSIQADLSIRGGKGDFSARSIEGDVSLNEIQGNVNLDAVMDDLYVRGVNGNLNAHVEGDAVLYLQPAEGRAINVIAEGDILLHMSGRASAALTLSAGDADDIREEMPGVPKRDGTNPRAVILGSGGAAINLKAEGDVMVTSRESDWESAAEFDFGGSWPLPEDFSERINRRVQDATRRAAERSEAAMRRAEDNMRRAEDNMRRQHGRRFSFNWSSGRGGHSPVPPSEPVSEEERMTILRMLQEKKITSDDAEKLLSALEGGG
jgi:hypothetical protein